MISTLWSFLKGPTLHNTLQPISNTGRKTVKEKGIKMCHDLYQYINALPRISQSFADEIGADGYSKNAPDAVKRIRQFVG